MSSNFLNTHIELCSAKQFKDLAGQLDKYEKEYSVNGKAILEALQGFQIRPFSIIYFYILSSPSIKVSEHRAIYERFFESFQVEHINYASKKFNEVLEIYVKAAFNSSTPIKYLRSLASTIARMDRDHNIQRLTRVHIRYIQLCIFTKYYKGALKVLNSPFILRLENNTVCTLEQSDLNLFFYHSALVYIAYRQFKEAQVALQRCYELNSQLTDIQIEAKKQLTLLSLRKRSTPELRFDKTDERGMEQEVLEYIAQPFADLGKQSLRNPINWSDNMVRQMQIFQKDGNQALARKTINGWRVEELKKLRNAYQRIKFLDLKKLLSIDTDLLHFVIDIQKVKHLIQIDRKKDSVVLIQLDEFQFIEDVNERLDGKLERLKLVNEQFDELHEVIIRTAVANQMQSSGF